MVDIDPMAAAANTQSFAMQERMNQLSQEKEIYLRLAVCLANRLKSGAEFAELPDGNIAIPLDEHQAVPSSFRVGHGLATLKAEVEEGEDEPENIEMVVLMIEPREEGNGRQLVVPRVVL